LGYHEVRTADRRRIDVLARDLLDVAIDAQRADLGDPRDDRDAPSLGEQLPRDGGTRHATRGLARAGATATPPVTHAVLHLVGVIGVTRAVLLLHLPVVARPHVLIRDEETDRRAERLTFEDAGEDPDGVGLLALGDDRALAGRSAVEIGLDVGFRERQPRRAPVDHGPHGPAVRFTPGRDAEESSPAIAHGSRIPRSTPRGSFPIEA